MNIIDTYSIAIKSIFQNRMRTMLSTLGIIIGIAAVVIIISVGQGGKLSIISKLEQLGSNRFEIFINSSNYADKDFMNEQDISILRKYIPGLKYISPLNSHWADARTGVKKANINVFGVNEQYKDIENKRLIYGRFVLPTDVDGYRDVVVIPQGLAKKLFGYNDVIGEKIFISTNKTVKPFLIVGVTNDDLSGMSSLFDMMRNTVYIPITSFFRFYGESGISQLSIKVENQNEIVPAMSMTKDIIQRRHYNKDIYQTYNAQKDIDMVNSVITIFTVVIGIVAAISLIVGGIGIMNIMLVSVSERTKEIGILKAVGAKNSDIMMQFLIECVMITLTGGAIGTIFGLLVSYIIASYQKWPYVIYPGSVFVALAFSVIVGIASGLYPAFKAANKNPIDSLRSE